MCNTPAVYTGSLALPPPTALLGPWENSHGDGLTVESNSLSFFLNLFIQHHLTLLIIQPCLWCKITLVTVSKYECTFFDTLLLEPFPHEYGKTFGQFYYEGMVDTMEASMLDHKRSWSFLPCCWNLWSQSPEPPRKKTRHPEKSNYLSVTLERPHVGDPVENHTSAHALVFPVQVQDTWVKTGQ